MRQSGFGYGNEESVLPKEYVESDYSYNGTYNSYNSYNKPNNESDDDNNESDSDNNESDSDDNELYSESEYDKVFDKSLELVNKVINKYRLTNNYIFDILDISTIGSQLVDSIISSPFFGIINWNYIAYNSNYKVKNIIKYNKYENIKHVYNAFDKHFDLTIHYNPIGSSYNYHSMRLLRFDELYPKPKPSPYKKKDFMMRIQYMFDCC